MKRIMRTLCRVVICMMVVFSYGLIVYAAEQDISAKVEALLAQMTLEEKVGQLGQVDIHALWRKVWQRGGLDSAAMEKFIVKYNIGSVLSGGGGYPDVNSPKEWAKMTNAIQKYTEKTRLKIPLIYGVDAVHGHGAVKGAVVFPYDIGLAAAGNPELAEKSAELTSKLVRATGVHWNFAPVLDVARDPRWGRVYETFGEDPYLAAVMGASMVRGYEKNHDVAATAKHYIGYGQAENGFDRQPADFSERTLRELYLPSFKAAIDAGVDTVMVNSGEVNGVPAHASKWLLQDILRKELGFQGVVVTDWEDIAKLASYHRVAGSLDEAVVRAFNAGIDMDMIPLTTDNLDILLEVVKAGSVPMDVVNNAVRRILTLKYELGLFENRYADETQADAVAQAQEQQDTARLLAQQSLTLLKNDKNVLPLAKTAKVLVVGPSANSKSRLCGGWTIDWAGAPEKELIVGKTILQGIQDTIGSDNVITTDSWKNAEKVKEFAQKTDVVVAVIGEEPYAEMKGDKNDLNLPGEQRKFMQALADAGKPVVLVVVAGRPLLIEWEAQNIPAILWAYLPGTEGGQAIVDVLFGDYAPAGRLPFTIPKSMGQIPMHYNDRVSAVYEPLFPFGFGLSYTTVKYANLQVPESVKPGEAITVTVDVENAGKIASDEVVQVYYTNEYSSVTPRHKQLCGFQRMTLQPGEKKTVNFTITADQLKIYNEQMQLVDETRPVTVQVADQSKTVQINQK